MPTPFLSSEEYDERAHQLYNEGQYDEALDTLREGLALYPHAVELQVGVGYARLAREEFAWARRSFDEALVLDPEHEDALAGLGEVLLKLGLEDAARKSFHTTLALGYEDDLELMLQIGRALFREGLIEDAKEYFEVAVRQAPDSAESVALVGYCQHRLGDDEGAITTLRRSLQLDADHAEARIYLGNILYDRGEYEAALYHLDRSSPDDHWDELGIWRLMELKKSVHRLPDDDPEIRKWEDRLAELAGEPDDIDEMLAEIEQRAMEQEQNDVKQLELFGSMLSELAERKKEARAHRIMLRDGRAFDGSWDDIVRQMRDGNVTFTGRSIQDYMLNEARRGFSLTGIVIPTGDAEAFIRGSADAGLLRILT
ncbi:MAG: tetratricopeptide repeat protein [Gemmatimonadetes bacterium]|nr:tetratricopeptide repeat protein [Gemmatimonadota bacterium]MCC6770478.1 tetratricopeptide repeat protein [Gemmatimonadaceae bacterium]